MDFRSVEVRCRSCPLDGMKRVPYAHVGCELTFDRQEVGTGKYMTNGRGPSL